MRTLYAQCIIHTTEAVVILGIAVLLSYLFPAHKEEAALVAFAVLSYLAKLLRTSPFSPIGDYVGGARESNLP